MAGKLMEHKIRAWLKIMRHGCCRRGNGGMDLRRVGIWGQHKFKNKLTFLDRVRKSLIKIGFQANGVYGIWILEAKD